MRHIPNILSCLRVGMVIAFIILFIKQQSITDSNWAYIVCLVLYITAFVTDVLDGYLARRFNWVSDFGKLVDPFADKFMFISAVACILSTGRLPWFIWIFFAILLAKELLLIVGGLIVLRKRKVSVYADMWGKTATGLFFAAVTLTLVDFAFNDFIPIWLLSVLYIAASVISIFSFFHYAYMAGFIGKKYKNVNAYEQDKSEQ